MNESQSTNNASTQEKPGKTVGEIFKSSLVTGFALTGAWALLMLLTLTYDLASASGISGLLGNGIGLFALFSFVIFTVKDVWYFFRKQIVQADIGQKRPGGLTAIAVMNFLYAGGSLVALVIVLSSPNSFQITGFSIFTYMILPLLGSTLLIVSGIGILKLNYRWGYVTGLAFSVITIGSLVVSGLLGELQQSYVIEYILELVYPWLLILLLVVNYRPYFSDQSNDPPAA